MEDWRAAPMASVNVDIISTKVQYYSKLVFQLARGLAGNPVVALLKSNISEFKVINNTL